MSKHLPIAQIPPFLNGYRVIAALPVLGTPDMFIVLVHRPDHQAQKYLTAAWTPECGTMWNSGDYVETLEQALISLMERSGCHSLLKDHDL